MNKGQIQDHRQRMDFMRRSMRLLLLGLLAPLAFWACRTTAKPAESTSPAPGKAGAMTAPVGPMTAPVKLTAPVGATTALPVTPINELPNKYTLVTRVEKDAARHYTATLMVPVAQGALAADDQAFNAVVDAFVRRQVEAARPDAGTAGATTLEVWLIGFNVSTGVIQSLFREQSYTEGAAHYNHGFLTLHYDVVGRQRVRFADLVLFSASQTKQALCDLINRHEQGLDAGETPVGGLTPDGLVPDLDFEVRGGNLVIYPNHCCADEGKTHVVPLKLVQAFLDPAVAKKFGS
ncbi:MAG: hypothetical protein CVU65_10240 [Deltaproteobacteria bacterium HGW-Deltaproteobacteria-22]|nr:MAG: hypothetical protein CVU65_10240 [Deltaproteobacteria bacterium HGW-Deltaproteobacteria-22]